MKKIYKLFIEDQRDRSSKVLVRATSDPKKWKLIEKRDLQRRLELGKILNKKIFLSGEDYLMAGMIFQHGTKISDSKKAIFLAKKAIELDNEKAKWLYAATTDRLLMKKGKKQKYGTQYQKKGSKWILYPVDRKTTDKERAKYNVIPLKKAIEKVKMWNKKNIDPWQEKRKTSGITSKK